MPQRGFPRFRISKRRIGGSRLGAPLRPCFGVTLGKTLAMPRAGFLPSAARLAWSATASHLLLRLVIRTVDSALYEKLRRSSRRRSEHDGSRCTASQAPIEA